MRGNAVTLVMIHCRLSIGCGQWLVLSMVQGDFKSTRDGEGLGRVVPRPSIRDNEFIPSVRLAVWLGYFDVIGL